jgi:hypothetical protein
MADDWQAHEVTAAVRVELIARAAEVDAHIARAKISFAPQP